MHPRLVRRADRRAISHARSGQAFPTLPMHLLWYTTCVPQASAPSKWLGLCDARDAGGRRLGSDPGYPIDSEIVMGPDSDK